MGGVLFCGSCTATVTGSSFHDNMSQNGGVLVFNNEPVAVLTSIKLFNNYAEVFAAVIAIYRTDYTTTKKTEIVLSDSDEIYNNTAFAAGFLASQNELISVTMQNCKLDNHVCTANAAVFGLISI